MAASVHHFSDPSSLILDSQNGFPITFQDQITFWLLGGENIVLSGGGTLDGAGQVSSH